MNYSLSENITFIQLRLYKIQESALKLIPVFFLIKASNTFPDITNAMLNIFF